jgi:hypothetical protein
MCLCTRLVARKTRRPPGLAHTGSTEERPMALQPARTSRSSRSASPATSSAATAVEQQVDRRSGARPPGLAAAARGAR